MTVKKYQTKSCIFVITFFRNVIDFPIKDGIMSPQDVDTVLTAGLGMRYATIGPYETIHLNAEGTQEYMEKYGETIKR